MQWIEVIEYEDTACRLSAYPQWMDRKLFQPLATARSRGEKHFRAHFNRYFYTQTSYLKAVLAGFMDMVLYVYTIRRVKTTLISLNYLNSTSLNPPLCSASFVWEKERCPNWNSSRKLQKAKRVKILEVIWHNSSELHVYHFALLLITLPSTLWDIPNPQPFFSQTLVPVW